MTTERELQLELRVKQLEGALEEISKLEGPFNRDPLKHCQNILECHKEIAETTLQAPTPDPSPLWDVLRAAVEFKRAGGYAPAPDGCLTAQGKLMAAVEALPAELRQLLGGGK